MSRRLFVDTRPLRESPAFRRLWFGSVVSDLGSTMTTLAVMLQVYDLTRSAVAVGAIGLARAIPMLVVGLLGGALTDAVDRRVVVLVATSCLVVISSLFAVQAFADLRMVWLLYVLVILQSVFSAINSPARRTFTPRLLAKDQLAAGFALSQLEGQVTFAVGPIIAGAVAAAGGLQWAYLVDAASFAAALYGVARLPAMRPDGPMARPSLRAVGAGLRFVARRPLLKGAFLADANATVFGMPVALFPAINAERFGGGALTLGFLTGALAIGGVVGSTFSGPVGSISRRGRAILISIVIWGAAVTAFGFSHILWIALIALGIAGAADTTSVVLRGTMVQQATPDEFRGRVTAIDYVVGLGIPQLGNFEAGAVGSLLTPTISAVSGGLACIVGALIIGVTIPAFVHADASTGADAAASEAPSSESSSGESSSESVAESNAESSEAASG